MASMPALELREVVRDYGKGAVIGPISCSAGKGEFVSLLGPSGCGKTTLLRCIAGFEPVDRGQVVMDGVDISRRPPHTRGVGLVFQSYALFPHLTVFDNVAFGLRMRRTPRDEIAAQVAQALRVVGLERFDERLPAELSGGQQQRVAIARSLVLEPSIMLLDEPLSSLDYKLRLQMRQELRSLQQNLRMTFVYVTHDQTEALALSDRVIVLSQGRIEQEGPPSEIYTAPRTRFVADFIGASNLLRVLQVERCSEGEVDVAIADGSTVRARAPVSGLVEGGRLWLCVRPENIALAPSAAPGDGAANRLTGRTVATVFSGDRTEVTIELDGARDDAVEPPRLTLYAEGPLPERLTVAFAPRHALLVEDR